MATCRQGSPTVQSVESWRAIIVTCKSSTVINETGRASRRLRELVAEEETEKRKWQSSRGSLWSLASRGARVGTGKGKARCNPRHEPSRRRGSRRRQKAPRAKGNKSNQSAQKDTLHEANWHWGIHWDRIFTFTKEVQHKKKIDDSRAKGRFRRKWARRAAFCRLKIAFDWGDCTSLLLFLPSAFCFHLSSWKR